MLTEAYHNDRVCPISGETENVLLCRLIEPDYDTAEGCEYRIARQEWIFGLPRGGMENYLQSPLNYAVFREDICNMYSRGEFILAPTFKTYLDMMAFVDHARVKERKDSDESPRRPMTAMASSVGLYRYVFLPFTDAARALQKEFEFQPQTREDLNGGIHPLYNKPCQEGSDQFSVVECRFHPFSVCAFADYMFWNRSTRLTAQWHGIAGSIIDFGGHENIVPPKWFIDAPRYELDDEKLAPSEATGYDPVWSTRGAPIPDAANVLRDVKIPEGNYRKLVAGWVAKLDPKAPPPEEKPIRTEYKPRRSDRIRRKTCPYDRSSPGGPPPSPTRNGARAVLCARRDLIRFPPAWTRGKDRIPTERFSSNDWAYFCYNIALGAPMGT
ncbi:hypothetical protein HDZ31DRAFT_37461 [Schizophyllum fasciatum]